VATWQEGMGLNISLACLEVFERCYERLLSVLPLRFGICCMVDDHIHFAIVKTHDKKFRCSIQDAFQKARSNWTPVTCLS
jgi:hypothetical protein